MRRRQDESPEAAPAEAAEEVGAGDATAADALLDRVGISAGPLAPTEWLSLPVGATCTARVLELRGRSARVALRGRPSSGWVDLDEEVDVELLARALEERDLCLLERGPEDERPVVVGVIQRRLPSSVMLSADTVTIEGQREVLLRAGSAALRLREDGDVELVGGRISAASRGLFKLVGRMLRLN